MGENGPRVGRKQRGRLLNEKHTRSKKKRKEVGVRRGKGQKNRKSSKGDASSGPARAKRRHFCQVKRKKRCKKKHTEGGRKKIGKSKVGGGRGGGKTGMHGHFRKPEGTVLGAGAHGKSGL